MSSNDNIIVLVVSLILIVQSIFPITVIARMILEVLVVPTI